MVVLAIVAMTINATSGAFAQVLTDETPANWKFDNHAKGSAKDLFVVEGAQIGGNLKYPFRLADSKEGAIVMNKWMPGGVNNDYENMTDEQKKIFEDFYDACLIVDAGKMGNIFCYQGKGSTAKDSRAKKNVNDIGVASMNIMTGADHPYGDYRITLTLRIIVNEGTEAGKMDVNIGTSHWDGIDGNGGTGDGYRTFLINYAPGYNKYWVEYAYDFRVRENSDPNYKVLPIVTKIGLGPIGNNALLLIDDIKLEKIQEVSSDHMPMKQAAKTDLDDTPASITMTEGTDLIVFANDGVINIIDAKSTIEIYTVSGKLLAKKQPAANSLTTFSFEQKGIYIVKTGDEVRKVIL